VRGIKVTAEDRNTSTKVKMRDNWTCQRCGGQPNPRGLHAAHMFTRRTRATRHDMDNLLTLCMGCHLHVDSHPEEKEALWLKRLGAKRFDALRLRAHVVR
jgi:5-methylcytosine-specific restriction endonuclease McrA